MEYDSSGIKGCLWLRSESPHWLEEGCRIWAAPWLVDHHYIIHWPGDRSWLAYWLNILHWSGPAHRHESHCWLGFIQTRKAATDSDLPNDLKAAGMQHVLLNWMLLLMPTLVTCLLPLTQTPPTTWRLQKAVAQTRLLQLTRTSW